MTLAEIFESRFRGDLRFRGEVYVENERVAIVSVTSDMVSGIVRDGVEYQTQLLRVDDELKMFCNCDLGSRPSATCKHLWATILSVDSSGYVPGSAKLGKIPPFIVDDPNAGVDLFGDLFDEEEVDYNGPGGRTSRRRTAVKEVVAEPVVPLRPWETQLQKLRIEMKGGDSSATSAGQEREIFYEIDCAESQEAGQLVVQISQRQRRASGQWGKLKPLKFRPGRFEEVDHEDDRTILAFLCGGTPDRGNWHSRQSQSQSMLHRFCVSHELCVRVLPLMCETGRVRILDAAPHSIQWDAGDPWELCMHVESFNDQSEWRLSGWMTRKVVAAVESETIDSAKNAEENNGALSEADVLPEPDALSKSESEAVISVPIDQAELLLPGGLMLKDHSLSRIQDFGAFDWVRLFCQAEPIAVPDGEEREFVDELLKMPVLPRLELPKHLQLEEVLCEPIPHLLIKTPSGRRWHSERVTAEVQFDYQGELVSSGDSSWAIVQRDQGRCLLRNRPVEHVAWSALQASGFRRLLDRKRGSHDAEIQARQLGSSVRALVEEGWQVRADGKDIRRPDSVQFRVESGIDWFELHADIQFGGATVSFPDLLAALVRGDTTVRMDDGSLGILPEEWSQQYGLIAELGTINEDHVQFAQHQVAIVDALLSSQEFVDYDDQFQELRDKFRAFDGITPLNEPEHFIGELREYQREGLGWLRFLQEFHFGGCLADDMGLGKTVQILALMQDRCANRKEKSPTLVVVPKSLLFNWLQESERFAPKLKTLEYIGLERAALRPDFAKYDLIFTTYGTMRRDALALREIQFDYVILDEAQTIKNAGSQVAKAARLLKANHRVALSGTPIENHLGDLWSIFEFLNPGMLGRSSVFKSFATDIHDAEGRKMVSDGLRPFILRRTKSEVASELPEKLEQTILCQMGDEQRRLYDELREHYRNSLLGMVADQGLAKSKMHVLEALLRLRQAACHPGLLDKEQSDAPSAKLDVLRPQLDELMAEGHKALVFSQFTSMLSILRRHLDREKIPYEYLDGQSRHRQESVERFQDDPDCKLFLISLKAGGLGLNLTAADYVFLLDPWWNPAVEAQAIDRAHRVGQLRQVFAYRLICQDTVEEKIAELQKKKRSLADAILEANNRILTDLTSDDLEMLLS